MLDKKTVDDLRDLRGKKMLIRCDSSMPLKEGVIQSYDHIDGAIPAIKKLLDQGAKVTPCSHLGKPKDEPLPEMSLAPVAPAPSERLGMEVKFVSNPVVTGVETQKSAAELKDGEVLLFKSARYRAKETKYGRDKEAKDYAKELTAPCDNGVLVNDAFGTAHRAHCSSVDATKHTKGNVVRYLMEKEIKFLGKAVENPVRLSVTILGDARTSDRTNVISSLLGKVDTLIVGGGMAYTLAGAQGQEIGSSLCEEDKLNYALEVVKKVETKDMKLLLPIDHVEGEEFSNNAEHKIVETIGTGWSGFDIRPKIIELYKRALEGTKTAVRNGPMDVFEFSNFAEGTLEVCRAVAGLRDVTTVIGGGDPVNAVKRLGSADGMTHISTGGGVPLEFLEGKEFPGVATADNR